MSVQIVIKPVGIFNKPNQVGELPPGSMYQADGVYLRRAGVLDPIPNLVKWSGSASVLSAETVQMLMSTDISGSASQYIVGVTDSPGFTAGMVWWSQAGTAVYNTGWLERDTGRPLSLVTNRPFWNKVRDRFVALSDSGVMIHDDLLPGTSTAARPRYAGILPPVFFTAALDPQVAGGGGIPLAQTVNYRVIVKRVYPDGYTLLSQPSFAINSSDSPLYSATGVVQVTIDPTMRIGLDIVEIYRTYSRATGTEPGPTYYLVASIPVTAANYNSTITVRDNTANTGLVTELYTNPGQESLQGANRQPPRANNVATYKGYTFYADLTQPPKAYLKTIFMDSLTGDVTANRLRGVGDRGFTGTTSIGSNVITGISAGDIVGLAVGQVMVGTGAPPFTTQRTVTAVGASTVTVDGTPASSAGSTIQLTFDTLYIKQNGSATWTPYSFSKDGSLATALAASFGFIVESDVPTIQTGGVSVRPNGLTLEPRRYGYLLATPPGASFEVMATNGQNWSPQLPGPTAVSPTITGTGITFSETRERNGFYFSKWQEPEACPVTNRGRCGSGRVVGLASTRDALWFFCTDGLWRLSGDGGNFRLDPVDRTLEITGPKAWTVLRDNVYVYTTQGLVRISSDRGVEKLTLDSVLELQGSPYAEEQQLTMSYEELQNEVWFSFAPSTSGGSLSRWWIYSANTGGITVDPRSAAPFEASTAVVPTKYVWNGGNGGMQYACKTSAAGSTVLLQQTPANYSGTSYRTAVLGFMPVFGSDPRTVKQWTNVTQMFEVVGGDSGDAIVAVPTWNETSNAGIQEFLQHTGTQPDSRRTFWCPSREAIAPMMKIGLSITPASSLLNYSYNGFMVEMQELTVQQRSAR